MVTVALIFAALSVVVVPLLLALALCAAARIGDEQERDALAELRETPACGARTHAVFRDGVGMPDRRGVR
jgi:hypothetical protein